MTLPPHWTLIPQHGNPPLFRDARVRRVTNRDPRHLPPLWEQRLDENSAPLFFFESVERPTIVDPRGCPEGWAMRLDDQGRYYFVNDEAKVTTSVDPRGLPEDCLLRVHQPTGMVYFETSTGRQVIDPRKNLSEDEVHSYFIRDWNAWWLKRMTSRCLVF